MGYYVAWRITPNNACSLTNLGDNPSFSRPGPLPAALHRSGQVFPPTLVSRADRETGGTDFLNGSMGPPFCSYKLTLIYVLYEFIIFMAYLVRGPERKLQGVGNDSTTWARPINLLEYP